MDFSDTVLLRESTKWWIVGAFLFIGTIFLISRSGSETTPALDAQASNQSSAKVSPQESQEHKIVAAISVTDAISTDPTKPIVCDDAGCPGCFQKIESDPNSNFASFDPLLTAIADEEKEVKDEKAKSELKAVIEDDDPLLRGSKPPQSSSDEKKQVVEVKKDDAKRDEEKKSEKKYDGKPLLTFVEKVPTDSEEWKKLTVEEKIARYLKMKVTFRPSYLSIEELVEQIGNAVDVEVSVDIRALEEASYDAATRLAIKSKRPRPLKSVLVETLNSHGLSYVIKDESLLITSEAKQKETMVTKIYPVVDLVMPLATEEDESPQPDFESLINIIQTTVQPKTWKEVSGDDNGGTIDSYYTTRLLVVRNTTEVQEELQELFTQLRTIKSPSTRKAQNVTDLVPEQPDKIVRRIYFISDVQQIGRSGAGAGRRGPGAYGSGRVNALGGSMGGGMSGGSDGGLFAVRPEKVSLAPPKTLSLSSVSTIAADVGGGQPAPQPAPNPSAASTGGGFGAAPSEQPAPNQAGNPGASVPETHSDILTTAQMKARMESLVEIIPGTVDPAHWDKEKTTISNMENRLIVIQTVASQIEIEKLLRGLKVLSRVETW